MDQRLPGRGQAGAVEVRPQCLARERSRGVERGPDDLDSARRVEILDPQLSQPPGARATLGRREEGKTCEKG